MMRIREERDEFGALVAALLLIVLLGLLVGSVFGQPTCHPAHADSTAVRYVATGANTAVKLIAQCDGIGETAWYVSFFEGKQPDLWTYAEIQNTASVLLRGL